MHKDEGDIPDCPKTKHKKEEPKLLGPATHPFFNPFGTVDRPGTALRESEIGSVLHGIFVFAILPRHRFVPTLLDDVSYATRSLFSPVPPGSNRCAGRGGEKTKLSR
jgi:hypothetical protein